ncbi:hypothetical protein C8R45DRAFT_1178742 [Mycena sanguinolenta]|nr:hypothetical protein C8R45DRAFT_1178742 [Mycena sanguinolenta]
MPFALLSFVSLAVLATPSLGQVTFTCLPGTTRTAFNCTGFATTFCQTAGTATVGGGDFISRCFNGPTGSGLQCNFAAKSLIPAPDAPSAGNCVSVLQTMTLNCPAGGVGQFSGLPFQFSVDPGNGTCAVEIDL